MVRIKYAMQVHANTFLPPPPVPQARDITEHVTPALTENIQPEEQHHVELAQKTVLQTVLNQIASATAVISKAQMANVNQYFIYTNVKMIESLLLLKH